MLYFSQVLIMTLGIAGMLITTIFAILVILFEKDKAEEKRLLRESAAGLFVFGFVTFVTSLIS